MYGNLNKENAPAVLRRVHRSRMSGILHFLQSEQSTRLYFKHGEVVFAGSDVEKDRLGEALVRANKLDREQLDTALRMARDSGRSLADYLVDAGTLSAEVVIAEAIKRMMSIVYSVFELTSGDYSFEPRDNPVDDGKAMSISLSDAILEGIRRIKNIEIIEDGIGGLEQVLIRPTKPALPFGPASLRPNEVMVYELARSLTDGKTTLAGLRQRSALDDNATLTSLYGLLSIGALQAKMPAGKRRKAAARARARATKAAAPAPRSLGRYQVLQSIGRGAMGEVLLAKDPAMDRVVAIKLIHAAGQLSPADLEKHRARFSREAKAAGKLMHPGIVTVFDVGNAGETTPYLVMEYVPGSTLRDIVDELTVEETLRIADGILDALSYAHSQGIVHRDIKPSNILVSPDLHAKILDFGIAHIMGAEVTDAQEVLGSPSYMSPEQLTKGALDQRTDLFSFGVVLYRCLTKQLPFLADNIPGITHAIVHEEPLSPHSVNALIPQALSEIALRCLSKNPNDRYPSAAHLKHALLQFRAGKAPSRPEAQRTEARSTATGAVASQPTANPATPSQNKPPALPSNTPAPRATVDASKSPPVAAPQANPSIPAAPAVQATQATQISPDRSPSQIAKPSPVSQPSPMAAAESTLEELLDPTAEPVSLPAAKPLTSTPLKPSPEASKSDVVAATTATPPLAWKRYGLAGAGLLVFLLIAGLVYSKLSFRGAPSDLETASTDSPALNSNAPAQQAQQGHGNNETAGTPHESPPTLLPPPLTDDELFERQVEAARQAIHDQRLDQAVVAIEKLESLSADHRDLEPLKAALDKAQRQAAETERAHSTPPPPEPDPPDSAPAPAAKPEPAQSANDLLFKQAQRALAMGELDTGTRMAAELARREPDYPGAKELSEALEHARWIRRLPLSVQAKHSHRLGGCEGTLLFESSGIRFRSDDHRWHWPLQNVRAFDRGDADRIRLRAVNGPESESQNFNFRTKDALDSAFWSNYPKLMQQ